MSKGSFGHAKRAGPEGPSAWACAAPTGLGFAWRPERDLVQPCHSPPFLLVKTEDEPRSPAVVISLLLLVAAHNFEAWVARLLLA